MLLIYLQYLFFYLVGLFLFLFYFIFLSWHFLVSIMRMRVPISKSRFIVALTVGNLGWPFILIFIFKISTIWLLCTIPCTTELHFVFINVDPNLFSRGWISVFTFLFTYLSINMLQSFCHNLTLCYKKKLTEVFVATT